MMWNFNMNNGAGLFLLISCLLLIGCEPSPHQDEKPKEQINVLFLGESDVFQPTNSAKSVLPYLTRKNIHLFYSSDQQAISKPRLARYQVIMINSKPDKITSSQERALTRFVEDGGGLVMLNSALDGFNHSSRMVKLSGGTLAGYGTGVRDINEDVVRREHPIMKGVATIDSRDEDLAFQVQGESNTVLSYRKKGPLKEPWTWVREQGSGRVFYTGWGSTKATWSNKNFRKLIERAIKWSAGDWALEMNERTTPFEYQKEVYPSLEFNVPLEEEKKPRPMQRPLAAEKSKERMVARPGFEVKLFASEPDIQRPLAMAWDKQGRLWITESENYPNSLNQDPEGGSDRIKILEDTNGDGKADKFTVFAKNLSIPTSLTFANGGVIVHSPPQTMFLKDTTGNDKADIRKVLFKGWGTFDTHAGPSNLRRGFDNWIWGVVGYSGFEGTVGGRKYKFKMGVYRFRPDGSELEFIRSTNNNTWGLGFSEEGYVFGSTANRNPIFYMPIANRYYGGIDGWSPRRLGTIAENTGIHPITDHTIQGDHKGNYTSCAGFCLYTARQFPKEYWNRSAFVGDPTVHLLGKFNLQKEGSDFTASNQWNMVASDDEWFAPIQSKVGPDGALWMIDWYNFIPTHNLGPFSEGWEHGKGNAFISKLRDKVKGRIYRVVYKGAPEKKAVSLEDAGPRRLVEALKNDNLFWRKTAQRLLVERGRTDILEDLHALIRNRSTDQLDLNVGAIHALWTLEGLDVLEDTGTETERVVREALSHPSSAVRRTAVKVLPQSEENLEYILQENLLYDKSSQVRLAALLKLSEMPESEEAGRTVYRMMKQPQNFEDRWIADAVTIAGAQHEAGFLKAAVTDMQPPLNSSETLPERLEQALRITTRQYAGEGPTDSIFSILSALQESPKQIRPIVLQNIGTHWPTDLQPDLTAGQLTVLKTLASDVSEKHPQIEQMIARWVENGATNQTGGERGNKEEEGEISVERGKAIASRNACQSCHSSDGSRLVGPSWHNLYDYERALDSGGTVMVNEHYLRESIIEPSAKIAKGFPSSMVSYKHLSENEIKALIAYIKSLSDRSE